MEGLIFGILRYLVFNPPSAVLFYPLDNPFETKDTGSESDDPVRDYGPGLLDLARRFNSRVCCHGNSICLVIHENEEAEKEI